MVTYKWLGRRYNVPYDTAKRILFEFVTRHPQVRQPCPTVGCRCPAPCIVAAHLG